MDEEIILLTKQYLRSGSLPSDVLPSPERLRLSANERFSVSDFAYGGASDRLIRRKYLSYERKPICHYSIPNAYTLTTLFQLPNQFENGGAETHFGEDIVTYLGDLYRVELNHGGGSIVLSKYNRGRQYNDFSGTKCMISAGILRDVE
jgi:hypothetical protein